MFYLYHHHDMQRLAELLAVLRQRHVPASPLTPDTVVVPGQGTGRWLQKQLAEDEGVLANVDFPLPAGFIWKTLIQDSMGLAAGEAWSRDNLVWHIYRLLPGMAREIPAVNQYLAAATDAASEVHRMQLAERLADVFDQYQVFRGDMLEAWDRSEVDSDSGTARWQAAVWQKLVAALGEAHRVNVLRRAIASLDADTAAAAVPTGRLICFGLAELPPDYLRLFYTLARHVDVHFLFPNPSAHYWGDISSRPVSLAFDVENNPLPGEQAVEDQHPLLASLGRPARDFVHLLYSDELTAIHEPDLGETLTPAPPRHNTLLAAIQRDVIEMRSPMGEFTCSEKDVSFQVHACHGPLREVQVLHDQLLDLMSRDDSLQPRDIVVMVPKLADYAPAIRSVFGAPPPGDRRRIPWSLSDQPRTASHPVVQTFEALLALPVSRWRAPDIMALVSVPAIMRRFGLDESDLDTLQHQVAGAGVRWGLDGASRQAMGAGDYDEFSWQFGLDRLLLGSALADDSSLVADVAPWTELEGGSAATAGRLHRVIRTLQRWRDLFQGERSPAQWHEQINALLAQTLAIDPEDATETAAIQVIHEALGLLDTAHACMEDEWLHADALREALRQNLSRSSERQPLLSGGVSFCGMQSLAGLPFRVVCLLGMNDGDFPRQDGGREFNLVLHRRQLGDRGNRDNDRMGFLQSLLAARDVFYISYTGTDVRNGEALEPATTVSELLDFVYAGYFAGESREDFLKKWLTRQPMQPFSPRYFSSEQASQRVFTFSHEWLEGLRARDGQARELPPLLDGATLAMAEAPAVALRDLRQFFDDPVTRFLRDNVGLQLDEAEAGLVGEEPFRLEGLSRWKLRDGLLAQTLATATPALDPEQPQRLWHRRGMLPPPPLGGEDWAEAAAIINTLLPVARQWRGESSPVDLEWVLASGITLHGRVRDVQTCGLRRVRPGQLKSRHLLPHWIDFLALCAAGKLDGTQSSLAIAGINQEGEADIRETGITQAEASRLLETLVNLYLEGQTRPLPFHPDLADQFLEVQETRLAKGESRDEALETALKRVNDALDPEAWHPHRLAVDPCFSILLEAGEGRLGQRPEDSEFTRLVAAICQPLRDYLAAATDEQEAPA